MWTEGQAVVRVIGGAVVERGKVDAAGPRLSAARAFGIWWDPAGWWSHALGKPKDTFGRLHDAAEWDAAEAKREQAARERISDTAERAEVRRRLRDVLALLPPERLAVLADELEREARGGR